MRLRVAIPLTLIGVAALSILAAFALAVGDLRRDPVTMDLWPWVGRSFTGLCVLLPVLILAGLCGLVWELWRWAHYHGPAIATAAVRERYPALGASEPLQLPAVGLAQDVTAQDLMHNYDPLREPHWLLIGQTGSGKSHAVFGITQQIASRFNSEFMIAERDGVDWNAQADARTLTGYAALLERATQERERRSGLMQVADVDHISGLRERLPLLVVVIEEAEAVYGRLFEMDKPRAKQFVANLRDLAGMGRKQGIVLIIATQTGTSAVFDAPTRRNLGNTLLFRSEAIVGDQFGVPRDVSLGTLPSGTAYALKYRCTVNFPLTNRPQLPHAALYHEATAPLLLPADAEADGWGAADQPDGPTGSTTKQNGGGVGVYRAFATALDPVGAGSDAARRGRMYRYWLTHGESLAAVEREFSPYKTEGGAFHYEAAAAINAMLRAQGQLARYQEQRPS